MTVPSQTEVLRQLAAELGAEFIEPRDFMVGGIHLEGGLHLPVDLWHLTLCAHTSHMKGTQSHMTRAHVCYASQLDFKFSISRRGLLLDILKTLTIVRDIEIGDSVFDNAFILSANNDEALRALLKDEALRNAILFHPPATLWNQYRDERLTSGPQAPPVNVDVLSLEAPEIILDLERLKKMLQLLTATLERLITIGVALRQPPGVEFRGPLGLTPPEFSQRSG